MSISEGDTKKRNRLTQIDVEAGIDATATGAYVVVLDANGDPVEGATTKLRIRGNPSLGSTPGQGVTAALLEGAITGSRTVQTNLNGTIARVRHDITADSFYRFTTLTGGVEVLSADGSPLPGVEVLQKTSKWLPVGTTDDVGRVEFEVLSGTKRSYRVSDSGTTAIRAHRFSEEAATLTFRRINASVVLLDAGNAGVAGVDVLTKAKKWETVGTTDASGTVAFEVFPGTKRSHRISINGTTAKKADRNRTMSAWLCSQWTTMHSKNTAG